MNYKTLCQKMLSEESIPMPQEWIDFKSTFNIEDLEEFALDYMDLNIVSLNSLVENYTVEEVADLYTTKLFKGLKAYTDFEMGEIIKKLAEVI